MRFHFYFILLTLIAHGHANAQFFGLRTSDEMQGYTNIVAKSTDNYQRVVHARFSHPTPQLRHQILVFNSQNTLIDSVQLPLGVSLIDQPVRMNNKFYWSAGYIDSLNSTLPVPFQSAFVEMDTNFNFVALHRIGYSNNVWIVSKLIQLGNHIFISEFSGNSFTSKIYKCTLNGTKTDSLVFQSAEIDNLFPYGSNFVAIGYGLPGLPFSNGMHKLILDTNLNIVSAASLDSVYTYNYTNPNYLPHKLGIAPNYNNRLIYISSCKYFVAGNFDLPFPNNNSYRLTVDAVFSQNDSALKTNVEANIPNNTCYTDNTVFAEYNNGTIAKVSSIGFDIYLPSLFQTQNSFLRVVKLDTNGNVIWSKNHGGDMPYRPRSIINTKDGGYLISGLRNNINKSPQPLLESFLLKLDTQGNFSPVSILEKQEISQTIECYPNPVNEELFFDLPLENSKIIKIFNLRGEELISINQHNNHNKINVQSLNPGFYFFTILTSDRQFYGKFLKSSY